MWMHNQIVASTRIGPRQASRMSHKTHSGRWAFPWEILSLCGTDSAIHLYEERLMPFTFLSNYVPRIFDPIARPWHNTRGMFKTATFLYNTLLSIRRIFSEYLCAPLRDSVKTVVVEKQRVIQFTTNETPPFVTRRSLRSRDSIRYCVYRWYNLRYFGRRRLTGAIEGRINIIVP